ANEWGAFRVVTDLGYVRLGSEHRIFTVATHHSQHCLYELARALGRPKPRECDPHLQRYQNTLRQNILCAADTTLEPLDWKNRVLEVGRPAGEVEEGMQRLDRTAGFSGRKSCRVDRVQEDSILKGQEAPTKIYISDIARVIGPHIAIVLL
ncbi:hypothetical protein BV22DRAFT_1165091, partial [Leucogyrophana mollusca]